MAKAILYSLVGDYGNNLSLYTAADGTIDAEMTAILTDRKTDNITPADSLVWRAYKYDPAVIDTINSKKILRGGTITAKVEGDKVSRTVTVGLTATLIAITNVNRKNIVIQNNSGTTIYLGGDATVSTTNGIKVIAGADVEDPASTGEWWAITTGAPVSIIVAETMKTEEDN